jgi:hypothetical protein
MLTHNDAMQARMLLLKFMSPALFYKTIAEIPGVAQDSIRNKGTREINYGSCISTSHPKRKTPGRKAPGTHWIGGWVGRI